MKYLWLTEAFEKKDTGMNNGAAQAIIDKDCFGNVGNYHYYMEHIYGEGDVFSLPERDFNLECVKMARQSKLTDFINCADVLNGFIISNKVVGILQNCELPRHRFYPVTLYHHGQKYMNYRFFYMEALGADYIDFTKSSFYLGNVVGKSKVEDIKLGTMEEYREKAHQLKGSIHQIRPERLVFNNCFNQQWDVFSLKEVDVFSYVSERLIHVFKKNEVTGYYAEHRMVFSIEVPAPLQTVE